MVSVSNGSRIVVYPLVRSTSEHRHIGPQKGVLIHSTCLPVCGFACTLDLELVRDCIWHHDRWKHPV